MKGLRTSIISLVCLALCACGGGGGGGGGSSSSSSSTSSSSSSGGAGVLPTLTFTAPATVSQDANAGIGSNPIAEFVVQFNSAPTPELQPGYTFSSNGIVQVAFFSDNGSQTQYRGLVYFEDPSDLGPGVFTNTITIGTCADAGCTSLRAGSTRDIRVTYTVTGTRPPPAGVTASTNSINVQAQSFTDTAPTFVVHLQYENVRANNSFDVIPTSTHDGVNGAVFERLSETEGNVRVNFKNASLLAPGIHDDVITIHVCQASKCPTDVVGSPITINTRYTISNATSGANGYTVRAIRQTAVAMTWDAPSARLYLAVPPTAPTHANSVIALDPVSGSVGPVAPIGNFPGALAASDDGQFLYVAPRESNELQRLRLPALTRDLGIALGGNADGNFAATFVAVAPGAPRTVAVLRSRLPFGGGDNVAVFDDTVSRPVILTRDDFAVGHGIHALHWRDATHLYGVAANNPPWLYDFDASAAGLSVAGSQPIAPLQWTGDNHFNFANGRIYISEGTEFDPVARAVAGTFTAPDTTHRLIGILADPANGRVFALSKDVFTSAALHAYDINTRALIATVPLFNVSFAPNVPTRLHRWGSDGLAMLSVDGQVVLVHGRFVTP